MRHRPFGIADGRIVIPIFRFSSGPPDAPAEPPASRGSLIELGSLLGATDQEMANALGIDQGTLDRWKTRHKEFCIAIQLGKIRADAEIAESLYNRARG